MRSILLVLALATCAWADPASEIAAYQAKIDSLENLLANAAKREATRAEIADSVAASQVATALITVEKDSLDYMYVRLRFKAQTGLSEVLAQGTIQEFVDAGGTLIWERVVRDRKDRALAGIARLKAL